MKFVETTLIVLHISVKAILCTCDKDIYFIETDTDN